MPARSIRIRIKSHNSSPAARQVRTALTRPPVPSKLPSSKATRFSKRLASSMDKDASSVEDQIGPRKKRRIDASIYTVRAEPDPQYLNPAALASARKKYFDFYINPLHSVPLWGNNPYKSIWKDCKKPDPSIHTLPPMDPVPPLKRLNIRYRNLSCVEIIRDWEDKEELVTSIFKVKYKGKQYILKVFRSCGKPVMVESGMQRYTREKRAYERLLHHGICSDGFAPMCYGWFKLPVSDSTGWLRSYALDKTPPYALLIEYIADGARLSVNNITVPVAEQAMLAVEHVHGAGVLHEDLDPRNTLVRPDGRVVIFDFDMAFTWPDEKVNRLSLKNEKQYCWDIYYQMMLPDQLIGLTPDVTRY